MASRAEQKARARAERIEFERKLAEAEKRKQRIARLAGVAIAAVIVIVAAIVISSGNSSPAPIKPGSHAANAAVTRVDSLLAGIPQSGNNTLGSPTAPVQITEYGDLECSACDDFALGPQETTSAGVKGSGVEDQIITQYVRTGKASLVYRSLDTATSGGATPSMFSTQQAAALAAGLQGKGWYYIELFYREQQPEGTPYVTQSFLEGLAKQVPGLNYSKWLSDLSSNSSLGAQVQSDATAASAASYTSTPTIVIKGPKGQAPAIQNVPTLAQLQQEIKAVS
ncbi:MAG TPA: thioredoxin domain-containing protein [Solirubrobacteraceae bacterium]|jgi:protein-disulfide isomerase|nr:thioredoxin domain-containing protein [Solirubrobacteraceae bacterium]